MSDLSQPPRSLLPGPAPAEPAGTAGEHAPAEPITPRLGETLVARKLLSQAQLQQALDEQQALRQRRLGELLLVEHIVTPAALAAAIERQARMPSVRIGEALVALGFISAEQLEQALAQQRRERSLPLGELLLAKGWITPADLQLALARRMGYPLVDTASFPLDARLLQRLPAPEALRLPALPLMLHRGRLVVALEDPSRRRDLEALEQACGGRVLPVLARAGTLRPAVESAYRGQGLQGLPPAAAGLQAAPESALTLLQQSLREALAAGASALHIHGEPAPAGGSLLWRLPAGLHPQQALPPGQAAALLACLRQAAGLPLPPHGTPQQALLQLDDPALQALLHILPTYGGAEDAVLALQPPARPLPLAALGLPPPQLCALEDLLQQPGGLLLCAGPAGPAPGTALHALLAAVRQPQRRCCTVEEALHVLHEGVRQWLLPPGAAPGIAAAARWLLQTGADVLLLGALHDSESAALALQAAEQGRWVLAPVPARSLQQAWARLRRLGLPAQDLAGVLKGLVLLQPGLQAGNTPGLAAGQHAPAGDTGASLLAGDALLAALHAEEPAPHGRGSAGA